MSELEFYFDPVCPFAWMTSKWVRLVKTQKPIDVDWRFIALRFVNDSVDYETHFPAHYQRLHTAGLELLRIAAAVKAKFDNETVARLYEAYGHEIFEISKERQGELSEDTVRFVKPILMKLDLEADLAEAALDTSFDDLIRKETEYALSLTGKDVGTPILHFNPPNGTALFGPVISRLPSPEQAVELWDHVVGLSRFAGFAELKRSLRETPQLKVFGYEGNSTETSAH